MNVREQIAVLIDKELSPEANRQRLIKVAKDTLAETLASGRASQRYTTAIDGHIGDVEQAQKVVTYRFAFIADAAMFALDFLKARVPEVTGRAAKSFWISVNDRYYAASSFNRDTDIPPDAEIVIGNLVPQWRRMDVNLNGGRKLRYHYPAEIDDCVRALRMQYGNTVSASRKYDYNFPNKYTSRNPPKRKSTPYQSPVLLLSAR